MGKYIDAEKLKAHIQYLIKKDNYELFDVPELLSFINSLQQEQLEVDLEKEIRSMWEKCNPTDKGMGVESTYMHIEAFDIIARHFYELGLNARKDALMAWIDEYKNYSSGPSWDLLKTHIETL